MRFNEFMHPRNTYKDNPPDFKQLSIQDAQFRQHCLLDTAGNVTINFKDPGSLKALTCALLKQDFQLGIEIPSDRLIPTVPGRLNYILWLEDLLEKRDGESTSGVDIGCGASCIYPLLGAKQNCWHFTATELDSVSYDCAVNNVKKNKLDNDITVVKVNSAEDILLGVLPSDGVYDFCMCNPPFYTFSETTETSKGHAHLSGTTCETITEGGEVAFVKKIIADSLVLKEKIDIYTSMVGKKESLKEIKRELSQHDISWITTEFCQGKTLRWAIAWSFCKDLHKVKTLQSPRKQRMKDLKLKRKPPMVFTVPENAIIAGDFSLDAIVYKLKEILQSLKLALLSCDAENTWVVTAHQNTWTHARKRRREAQRKASKIAKVESEMDNPAITECEKAKIELDTEKQEVGKCAPEELRDVTKLQMLEGLNKNEETNIRTTSIAMTCSNVGVLDKKPVSFSGETETSETSKEDDSKDIDNQEKFDTDELFSCTLTVRQENSSVLISMKWQNGDKNAMHDLFQYIKNKFLIPSCAAHLDKTGEK